VPTSASPADLCHTIREVTFRLLISLLCFPHDTHMGKSPSFVLRAVGAGGTLAPLPPRSLQHHPTKGPRPDRIDFGMHARGMRNGRSGGYDSILITDANDVHEGSTSELAANGRMIMILRVGRVGVVDARLETPHLAPCGSYTVCKGSRNPK
jgi:hypothetical protein